MRWLSTLIAASSFACVCAYGGHGVQSTQFKERVDFEPKRATLSPVLPPGETPYFPPPEIPMPDKPVTKDSSSESAESTEVECGPSATPTTTEHPQVQGCGSATGHVEVDSEVSTALKLVPPPAAAVDAATAGDGHETGPPKKSVAVAGYESGSGSSSSYSSATKEEAAIYGLGETASSPGSIPPEATTLPETIDVVAGGGGAYGPIAQPAPSVQVEVAPSTSTLAPEPVSTEPSVEVSSSPSAPAPVSINSGYEVEVPVVQVPVAETTISPPASNSPSAPVNNGYKMPAVKVSSVSIAAIETASPSPVPDNGYEVELPPFTLAPEPTTIEVSTQPPAPTQPPATTQSTTEQPTTEPIPPVQTTEIEVPPAVNGYEEPQEETPAQQIAHIPDNENLYERIEEVQTTPTVIPSTETTILYVPPTPAQTAAPYQPPAPRAETPSSGYEVESEVTIPTASSSPVPPVPLPASTPAPAPAPEPYGQRVEAAHITDETAGSDYDSAAGVPEQSSPSSKTISSVTYDGDGGIGTSTERSNIAPSAVPYVPQAPAISTSGNSYSGSSNFGGNNGAAGYATNGGGYASSIGASAYPSYASPPLAQPQYVAPPPPPPAFHSFAPAAPSYSTSQQQGCCGGSWFSSQGSLCAPVNYNSCQTQQTSSGCGGGCNSGCGQSSYGFSGSAGCGCSSGCGCQPACTPCTPVANPCPQPCSPPQSSCCCPSAPAPSPFAGFCGGRKKRSIQTLLGLCGRKRA